MDPGEHRGADLQRVVDGDVNRPVYVEGVVVAILKSARDAESVRWADGRDVDDSPAGRTTEQCTLRASQHFDLGDVEQRRIELRGSIDHEVIDRDRHGRVADLRGVIGRYSADRQQPVAAVAVELQARIDLGEALHIHYALASDVRGVIDI